MSAFVHVRVHFIWSTKGRERRIDAAWRDRLFGYISGICEKKSAKLLIAGGVEDHVHLYVSMPATISIADMVNVIKSNSSGWVHDEFDKDFAWQTKYAAFSVSKSGEDALFEYIRGQEEHHRVRSYREELVDFLARHGMEWDERYLLE